MENSNRTCSALYPDRYFCIFESQESSVYLHFPGYSFPQEQYSISGADLKT